MRQTNQVVHELAQTSHLYASYHVFFYFCPLYYEWNALSLFPKEKKKGKWAKITSLLIVPRASLFIKNLKKENEI
jgi:hypothetical protein